VSWVYAFPTWLFATTMVAAISGGAVMLHWWLHGRGWRGFREHNDITGFILTIVGAIYAVVLGFVAVVVWEQYEASRQNQQHEVNVLSSLFHVAEALPDSAREPLRDEIATYIRLVVNEEWPAMRKGSDSVAAGKAAGKIVDTVIGVQETSKSNVAVEALTLVGSFMDARRQRLQDNHSGIPLLLWLALLAGGLITVGLGYLFGIESLRFHAIATGCVAAMIALILVLIARLDYPYQGDSGIPPTDWEVEANALPPN
jgi:hypothetical protein